MAPSDDGEAGNGIDRRRALIGLGAGTAAAWAAPTIISQAAASAATVQPGCSMCDEEAIVNGGAESGVLTPWQTVVGSSPFSAALWANVPAITPQPGSGSYLFLAQSADAASASGIMDQDITIDPACALRAFDLEADLGAVVFGGNTGITVSIEFFDASNIPLGNGGALPLSIFVSDQSTDTMSPGVTTGLVPTGATLATVTVDWSSAGESPFGAQVAADNLSFEISCGG